ncbi:hypothetical protein PAPYR_6714 [Paratrimastix pyriformis]|uniref:F-box domain-containing protein n=1 Tax=Paratrimastix pyriformis TaxID=342808 RepID=A0ABQ8UFZ5_9EUKA|nr:hypothetical protein PAPYR_6714 [Paratrimastix pyriformis]
MVSTAARRPSQIPADDGERHLGRRFCRSAPGSFWSLFQVSSKLETSDPPSPVPSYSSVCHFPIGKLPLDLLFHILNCSLATTRLYCAMIGVSRRYRTLLRESNRFLSFAPACVNPSDCEGMSSIGCAPLFPASVLASLIGPCCNLYECVLPSRRAMQGCGREESAFKVWVDSMLTIDHATSLRVLRVPCCNGLSEGALSRMLTRLPHLAILEVGGENNEPFYENLLVGTIGRSCPELVELALYLHPYSRVDYGLLQPCTQLRELTVTADPAGTLLSLLSSLHHLEHLHFEGNSHPQVPLTVDWVSPAHHFQDLNLLHHPLGATNPPDPSVFLQLRRLTAGFESITPVGVPASGSDKAAPSASTRSSGVSSVERLRLVTLSSTLRVLTLHNVPHAQAGPLAERLARDLPVLAVLSLLKCPGWSHLPPALVDLLAQDNRLTHFTFTSPPSAPGHLTDLRLRAPGLRELTLDCLLAGGLALDCPALERLELPRLRWDDESPHPFELTLTCPALRTLVNLSPQARVRLAGRCDRLVKIKSGGDPADVEPSWLQLLGEFPALEQLSLNDVTITRRATLEALCGGLLAPRLVSLRELEIASPDDISIPEDYALQVSPSLRALDILGTPPLSLYYLTLHAPGLRHLSSQSSTISTIDLVCPHLAELYLSNAVALNRLVVWPTTRPPGTVAARLESNPPADINFRGPGATTTSATPIPSGDASTTTGETLVRAVYPTDQFAEPSLTDPGDADGAQEGLINPLWTPSPSQLHPAPTPLPLRTLDMICTPRLMGRFSLGPLLTSAAPTLRELRLVATLALSEWWEVFAGTLSTLPHLHLLMISGLTVGGTISLSCGHLHRLHLDNCKRITRLDLGGCPELEDLTLSDCRNLDAVDMPPGPCPAFLQCEGLPRALAGQMRARFPQVALLPA